ncbi:MAG TPA: branched-chain amino acid ABC transporter permease [Mesorhizobium sp.]|nr:branched-chain amino acid ABC transporter permease [Mesorhizobium sp.]
MMQFLVDSLLRAGDLMLVTLGLSTVYAMVRFPNMAQTEYATIGAFVGLLLSGFGMPLWLCVVLSALVTGIVAVALHRFAFARLLRSSPVIAMIGSLAVAMIIRSAIQAVAGTRSERFKLPIDVPHQFMGAVITTTQIVVLAVTALVVVAFLLLLFRTNLGRSMRAVAAQPDLARACGISSGRVVDIIGFLGGAFAAIGGTLLAIGSQVHFNLGQDLLLPVFAAAIVGGLGSPIGAIFGVLLLALVETLVTNLNFGPLVGETFLYVPLAYGPAAGFCLLVVTLMFRPRGLFHSESKRV